MNGAQALVAAAVAEGIDVCFANPGTTELPLVLALDSAHTVKPVLCLHENVATGAADGYARLAGKPAMCLLHLGPGLANGLTNLHNARRAFSPVLCVVGQHASWHLPSDPPLAADIEGLARVVGKYVKESQSADAIAADTREAIAAAIAGRGVATLIVPHDFQLADGPFCSAAAAAVARRDATFDAGRVEASARSLRAGNAAIFLGGDTLSEAGLRLAGRIAAATGADLYCDTFFPRMERGKNLPRVTRLPYFIDQAVAALRPYEHVIIVGTKPPSSFFGYPGHASLMITEQQTVLLTGPEDDSLGALTALSQQLNAPDHFAEEDAPLPEIPRGALNAATVGAVIARLQPENAIIMDEALTVGAGYFEASRGAPRFTHMLLTGGAIGQGPGAATGAAIACPDRKVINFQSDGCGAYSVQAFWTQANQGLDVVTVIGSNRSYNILKLEFLRAGVLQPGTASRAMTSLDRPPLDWVRIGEGFGVPSVAVDTAEGLARELEKALSGKGPRLIEAIVIG